MRGAKTTKTVAASVALSPRSAKIDVWWKISAVVTSPGVASGVASSQNVSEVSTRRSSTSGSPARAASDAGGASPPSGKSPTSSGRLRASSSAAGTTSSSTITPSTAYASRQPRPSMSSRDSGGRTAFDSGKPSPISAIARPRRATNH